MFHLCRVEGEFRRVVPLGRLPLQMVRGQIVDDYFEHVIGILHVDEVWDPMEDGLMVVWRYVDQFWLTQLDRKPVQQVYHLLVQLQMVGAFQELLHVLHWRDHVVDLRQPVKSFGRFVHYMLRIRDQPYIIARRDNRLILVYEVYAPKNYMDTWTGDFENSGCGSVTRLTYASFFSSFSTSRTPTRLHSKTPSANSGE
ncbi:unnamed protein product, partial [Nesidiocoris tenuis]